MPNVFDKLWNRFAEPRHQTQFGVDVTYLDETNTETRIRQAIPTREIVERRYNEFGGYDFVITRKIRFPIENRVFSQDGKIILEGQQYSIENIAEIEGIRYEMHLIRVEAGRLTAPQRFRG